MSYYNLPHNINTSHPIIPNSQEYIFYQKYVSIHSEDRDILKYPNSNEFEIEMPEDITNISAIKLIQCNLPNNYNPFSILNNNVFFAFNITNPYNPSEHLVYDELTYRIFEALFYNINNPYEFAIEEGSYTAIQMATELTNKMNAVVTYAIQTYFTEKAKTDSSWSDTLTQFNDQGGYSRFIVVYNDISCKLWFGNRADNFTLINDLNNIASLTENICIGDKKNLNDSLSTYLGLPKTNSIATNTSDLLNIGNFVMYDEIIVPRFYYGDVFDDDKGYWLLPYTDLTGSNVYWVEPSCKINLINDTFVYIELAGQNCINETKPFNISYFTQTTNQTNGVVNAAFAKIPLYKSSKANDVSHWFDRDSIPYKFYYPPAERIRRLRIKLRYHNGQPVNFGNANYSFMLEFTIMLPMILREAKTSVYPPPMHF